MLKIVADENMAGVRELFSGLGELRCLPGRNLRSADVADADILLVRSVTRVDRALLAGSRVRFVGTATIGVDHLDLEWLRQQGIAVASAPGCNAASVVEYDLAALSLIHVRGGLDWDRARFGVVGLGNVGGLLARTLQAMGVEVMGCDPFAVCPGIRQTGLDALLEEASVILLHTPLTRDGEHPTWHLLDEGRLARLGHDRILLNAGRGECVDNDALSGMLASGAVSGGNVVLDVWENEPSPEVRLLEQVALATPHIAGYSVEGKWRGTDMVRRALLAFLGREPDPVAIPAGGGEPLRLDESGWPGLCRLVLDAYPVWRDDRDMRSAMAAADPDARKRGFDRLRKEYWPRHEFGAREVRVAPGVDRATRDRARAMGFRVAEGRADHENLR